MAHSNVLSWSEKKLGVASVPSQDFQLLSGINFDAATQLA